MLDDEYYQWFAETHKNRKPCFEFPQINPFVTLSFERLEQSNYTALFEMFAKDDSAFVDERFKNKEKARDYARFLEVCGAYQGKHGCADWLFKVGNNYAGVLHLYDLSRETICQNHKRAWIGFATAQAFRNQGLTFTAVSHLIQTIFSYYKQVDFIHAMTFPQNTASGQLLRKLNFVLDGAERMSKELEFYILSRPSLS